MESRTENLWHTCMEALRDAVDARPFQTWLEPISMKEVHASEETTQVVLEVPSDFHRDWVGQHYEPELRRVLSDAIGTPVRLRYTVAEHVLIGADGEPELPFPQDVSEPPAQYAQERSAPQSNGSAPQSNGSSTRSNGSTPRRGHAAATPSMAPLRVRPESMPNAAPRTLNPNYTFDSFLEADCNRLARSAGVAVSEQPGVTSFNPFLIYGRVGLGKTHLAHAIGNAIAGAGPRTSVLYMTSEAFTNCFVQAIQNNTLADFTTTFRQIDVLIVDDIQFFGGKEKTQEQFFHLFNDLHQRGKQIVLCADRSPAEIDGIEERLLSRFRWGLSADVQPPDLETRTAILQSHCKRSGLELSHDIVDYIAYNVRDNIRLLEGAFNRLYALNRVARQELTLPFVQEALADLIQARVRKTISASEIRDIVAEFYSLDPTVMAGKSRKRHIVDARQTAMHFCKALTQLSLEAIGKQFGGRDHSTVIHACKAVQARLDTDTQYKSELASVERLLTQRIVHA